MDADIEGALIAYFLVPLPEPMSLPTNVHLTMSTAKDYGAWLSRVADGDADMSESPRVRSVVSAVAHHRRIEGGDHLGSHVLFELARDVLLWAVDDTSRGPRGPTFPMDAATDLDSYSAVSGRDVTMVEVAVSVDITVDLEAALSNAFDEGLDHIRDLQRAYHLVRRAPITLCTREVLPPMVPYAIGVARDGDLPAKHAGLSVYLLHTNIWSQVRDPELSPTELDTLRTAIGAVNERHAFRSQLESAREADAALPGAGTTGAPRSSPQRPLSRSSTTFSYTFSGRRVHHRMTQLPCSRIRDAGWS